MPQGRQWVYANVFAFCVNSIVPYMAPWSVKASAGIFSSGRGSTTVYFRQPVKQEYGNDNGGGQSSLNKIEQN